MSTSAPLKTIPLLRPARTSNFVRRAAFPHAARIASGTGVGVPGTWSVDPELRRHWGVEAITDGTHTTFADTAPSLRIAAHEAVHQVQHAGMTRDCFLGPEVHAELVARALTRGKSASALVSSVGNRVAAEPRGYVQLNEDQLAGSRLEAQVDGSVKVAESGRALTSVINKKLLYASRDIVDAANRALESQASGLRMIPLRERIGPERFPAVTLKPMSRIGFRFGMHGSGSDKQEFYEDCGASAREVIGPSGAQTELGAICRTPDSVTTVAPSDDPDVLRARVLVAAGLGRTEEEALSEYYSLDEASRRGFDRRYKLNEFADPRVGEAYVMANPPKIFASEGGGSKTWGFHWGAVILKTGLDRVTFEAAATSKQGDWNKTSEGWGVDMYGPYQQAGGPRRGELLDMRQPQTFHEEWRYEYGDDRAMTLTAGQVPTGREALFQRVRDGRFADVPTTEVEQLSMHERNQLVSLVQSIMKHSKSIRRRWESRLFLARIATE